MIVHELRLIRRCTCVYFARRSIARGCVTLPFTVTEVEL